MNEDAFARRFYADRAELESLGIALKVDRPARASSSPSSTRCRPRTTTCRRSSSPTASSPPCAPRSTLLDGQFAYAEPLRLALQQVSWGRKSPLPGNGESAPIEMAMTASAGGRELSQRLAKIETAISRRKTIQFSLLHDGAGRDGRPQGRSVPPRLPLRPVLFDRLRARARCGPRLPALADPGQGLLREQGRARLQPARATSTATTTAPAPTGRWARQRDARGSSSATGSTGWSSATTASYGEIAPASNGDTKRGQGLGLRDRLRLLPAARRLAARLAPARRRVLEPAGAGGRGRGAPRPAPHPPRRATSRPRSRSAARPSPTPSAAAAPTARPRP